MSIGVFHYSEYIITEPMSPAELSDIIYDQCMPHEPIEAVLQQEVWHIPILFILYYTNVFLDINISWWFDYTTWYYSSFWWNAKTENWVYALNDVSLEQIIMAILFFTDGLFKLWRTNYQKLRAKRWYNCNWLIGTHVLVLFAIDTLSTVSLRS